eukprot:m.61716 g.61716  ORF g.61716 m.61716 type:complete len:420 (+) comp7360_c0_seq1:32-1291(+)
MSGSRLAKQGWLTKQGKVRKSWKRRWMVLDPEAQTLSYHVDGSDLSNPKGVIALRGTSIIDSAGCEADIGIQHCLGIVTRGRKYYMFAESKAEYQEWYRYMRIVASGQGVVSDPGSAASREDPTQSSRAALSRGGPSGTGAPRPTAAAAARDAELRRPREQARPSTIDDFHSRQPLGEVTSLMTKFKRARDAGTRDQNMKTERLKTRVLNLAAGGKASAAMSSHDFCEHCHTKFNLVTNRRQNCRLCGQAVCGKTGCSDPISILEIAKFLHLSDASVARNDTVITMCIDCETAIKSTGQSSAARNAKSSPLTQAYDAVVVLQHDIDKLLIEFNQNVALARRQPQVPQHLADECRRLHGAIKQKFEQLMGACKRIETLPTLDKDGAPTQMTSVQRNAVASIKQWHQARTFTLHALATALQ